MGKIIDLKKTVYDICNEVPEAVSIMRELGFASITNPSALKTVGRFMTIPKGAVMKGISLDEIKTAFVAKGYKIVE